MISIPKKQVDRWLAINLLFVSNIQIIFFNTVIKIDDIKKANHLFWLFVNRLRRYLDSQFHVPLKYLASWEVQPRSKRIHYHIILFDFPYIPVQQLSHIWKNGYIFIEKIDKVDSDRRGSYIAKYLTKNIEEYGVKLHKVKRFFKSQNLKPINEKHFLLDRGAFDKDSAEGLVFESIYFQKKIR
ncbi:rolling circle replication-associated protein [Secundilactobacillus silagei]|uniref:rolling circle replication-associated protein n=1 Tax=Secundilactobacillus silagei TaxID=1293415 RepID=UPI0006D2334C